ncbi:MAG: aminoglycoside phosphotransferase family protein [Rhodocyclaceae bacterium]|nr:aminoglycoside phosphotransferase family protein [Rhodocyclaceae bacterium]
MTIQMTGASQPDLRLIGALMRAGLIENAQGTRFEALTGGVSSDIWKVTTPGRTFCVKRALAKLKVAADWNAPVERNRYEVAWTRIAHEIVPGSAPEILYHDDAEMFCAMRYLAPADHRLWKNELRDGRADPAAAAEVGRRLGRIHAATANNPRVAAQFPRHDIFHAIRLEPYLEATAAAHPDLHQVLFALSRRTGDTRIVMIHGDVSPKNILLGPDGPVFLDAECACIGDPAFDLAFCLNHLLLKCIWNPAARSGFHACFESMAQAYLAEVNWEPADTTEQRAASLLPGLLLARVDGKSPVEYIHTEEDRARIRHCARALLESPPSRLSQVLAAWEKELDA